MRQQGSRALYAYWDSLRSGKSAPDRADFDPSHLGRVLQDVFILGRAEADMWLYRVAGSRLSTLAGRELRDDHFGRWWTPADRAEIDRMTRIVSDESIPMVGGVEAFDYLGGRHEFELLMLPLRHGGRTRLRMIGGLFPAGVGPIKLGTALAEIRLISLRSLELGAYVQSPVFGRPRADLDHRAERRRSWRVIEGGRATP